MKRTLESNSMTCWYNLYYKLTKRYNQMLDMGGLAGTQEMVRTDREIKALRPVIREMYQH